MGQPRCKQSKVAIVSVLQNVFNEMQGFSGSNPFLADLERKLTEEGKYDLFKEKFEDSFGSTWEESRSDFDFIQDDVVEVLDEIEFMSIEAGRNWCEKATGEYTYKVEDFARLVKKYLDKKESNHHIVFLIDEIGQYIGDDSKLMLNLQTVTEDLGTACGGKAWIIVTSQQDIDSITKTKGNDFSKIQGRFDTRLSLSSANVDEVIKKRILEKNEAGKQTLTLLYDDKATVIKNLILFNDGVEKKLYSDRENFADIYPFIPYQFNLLGSVLTSIRTHGASGKHLAEGERSMLALFKESAVKVMNDEPGTIVPFNMFYDALEQFLDHSHKGVISRALDNEYLNPNHEKECFDVNVLKTLFMIKYVKEIKANIENITSLMVSNVNDDRMALAQQVEDALKRLVRQTLVQKNGDIYVFLTDEEQEINRAIESQNVDSGEVIAKVSEMIFDGLYDEKKYRYPAFNGRYAFAFNQVVDDKPYKANQNNDITLKILTPNSDERADETTMRILSGQSSCVLVVLPDDRTFLDEIRSALQIEKFIRFDATNTVTQFESIKEAKKVEMRERNGAAKLFLSESLKNAEIYVNGDKIQSGAKEIASKINEALGKLVSIMLVQKYDVVVTNPPYMPVSNAGAKLSDYVKENYPDSKTDLFAVFIERCKEMLKVNGYQAMITMHSWLFISSYEKLRKKILLSDIISMAHLGARAFDEIAGEVVQTTSFVMRKSHFEDYKGTYCRLIEPTSEKGKADEFLAENNRYYAKQKDFGKIPGMPISYRVSKQIIKAFDKYPSLGEMALARNGMKTGDNNQFVRLWWEVADSKFNSTANSANEAMQSGAKWFPYNKGGEYRKWYGNNDCVVNWENEGACVIGKAKIEKRNVQDYPNKLKFLPSATWSLITSKPAFRYKKCNISDIAGMSFYPYDDNLHYYLGLLDLSRNCLWII